MLGTLSTQSCGHIVSTGWTKEFSISKSPNASTTMLSITESKCLISANQPFCKSFSSKHFVNFKASQSSLAANLGHPSAFLVIFALVARMRPFTFFSISFVSFFQFCLKRLKLSIKSELILNSKIWCSWLRFVASNARPTESSHDLQACPRQIWAEQENLESAPKSNEQEHLKTSKNHKKLWNQRSCQRRWMILWIFRDFFLLIQVSVYRRLVLVSTLFSSSFWPINTHLRTWSAV